MRRPLTAALLTALLALGTAACDDTVEGIQEDAESIEEGVEAGVDEATTD
jgi:predicted small secreted protein